MDSHLFCKGRWVIDLSDSDSNKHLGSIGFSQDTLLIMKYFVFFLFVDTSKLNSNEFSERHDEIKWIPLKVIWSNTPRKVNLM